jgi:hypothetical protein
VREGLGFTRTAGADRRVSAEARGQTKRGPGMAFNNPSSRTPVSYGSATKSLGYIVGAIGRAFSSDNDEVGGLVGFCVCRIHAHART